MTLSQLHGPKLGNCGTGEIVKNRRGEDFRVVLRPHFSEFGWCLPLVGNLMLSGQVGFGSRTNVERLLNSGATLSISNLDGQRDGSALTIGLYELKCPHLF